MQVTPANIDSQPGAANAAIVSIDDDTQAAGAAIGGPRRIVCMWDEGSWWCYG